MPHAAAAHAADTPFPHHIAGFAVHDELALYVDAGLTPVEALRCATSTNASILGLSDKIGRLAVSLGRVAIATAAAAAAAAAVVVGAADRVAPVEFAAVLGCCTRDPPA